ncbi:MBL fold metallo-hydrolase [Blattabacterium cuenoti]|uniref:MBL fold metallo-hydrolase n=1 Tax=Blattabacterium cuenoti TaxID=1653831 RepID=UPI00163C5F23|nr:MBL fold metallo-hydrolase [Blattabacterium cuenoti]
MKITFLGTGNSQGIPIIGSTHPVCLSKSFKDKRLRSSIIIEKNNQIFLIDCSPDFRYQMLRTNYNKLDAIFITHEHQDHIGGLDDIRPLNLKNNPIPIYGLRRVLQHIKHRFYYIFTNQKTSNISNLSINEINDTPICINNIEIIPLYIWHGKLLILGFRIDNFAYITDASSIPINTKNKLQGLDILVLNILRKYSNNINIIHTNLLYDSLNMIQYFNPKKAYITHISHFLGFHETIQANLPKNIYLAYDGLEI